MARVLLVCDEAHPGLSMEGFRPPPGVVVSVMNLDAIEHDTVREQLRWHDALLLCAIATPDPEAGTFFDVRRMAPDLLYGKPIGCIRVDDGAAERWLRQVFASGTQPRVVPDACVCCPGAAFMHAAVTTALGPLVQVAEELTDRLVELAARPQRRHPTVEEVREAIPEATREALESFAGGIPLRTFVLRAADRLERATVGGMVLARVADTDDGFMAVDARTGEVHHVERGSATLANTSLEHLGACVDAMHARFPFHDHQAPQGRAAVVAKALLRDWHALDPAALEVEGSWWAELYWDVDLGTYNTQALLGFEP